MDVGSFTEAKPSSPLWNPIETRSLQVKGVTMQQIRELFGPAFQIDKSWPIRDEEIQLAHANGDTVSIYQNPEKPERGSGQIAGGCQVVFCHRMTEKDVAVLRLKSGRHDPFRRY